MDVCGICGGTGWIWKTEAANKVAPVTEGGIHWGEHEVIQRLVRCPTCKPQNTLPSANPIFSKP